MDSEQFNVIFCSRNANVINNTNLNAVSYYVNWDAFLPKKYKKFNCAFIFKSENYAGFLTEDGFVNINMGKSNNFDGTTQTNNIGIVYAVILTSTACYYNSTNNDNNNFYCDYPSNNVVTITLNQFSGTAMANMPNYTLILNMVGILE
jgi:hypothetical protein